MTSQPKIANIVDNEDVLTFTLSRVNVSIANALRRTVISDIPTVVFKTTPQEENTANIITNTSRMNNEILKQRLSCIPIYIEKLNAKTIDNYLLEVNVENNTSDSILYVTTKDFRVRDISEDKLLDKETTQMIFPPWTAPDGTKQFIEFVSLRPILSESIPGEKISFTAKMSYGTSKENAMYNCVSVCSYGCTPDLDEQEVRLTSLKKDWEKNKLDMRFEETNWRLLEGQRIILDNSFDFMIQTIGVYTNVELLQKACDNIIQRLNHTNTMIKTKDELIVVADNTMSNCYDIILLNEDYTIGKVIEYMLYSALFNVSKESKLLNYCGFKKLHPHDTYSIIRLAYIEDTPKDMIKQNIDICISDGIEIFRKMKGLFQ